MSARGTALLSAISWEDVYVLNQFLCSSKRHQFGLTSEGYAPAKALWDAKRHLVYTIAEMADLCLECHRLAPFLFLNGNTFVAIARDAIAPQLTGLTTAQQVAIRAGVGHFIAGTIRSDELGPVLKGNLR